MSRDLLEREARRRLGERLGGRYELTRLLGCGGMGAVFDALDHEAQRHVAVKLLLDAGGDDDALARFAREARLLAALDHPHIVRVRDQGADDHGTPFLVEDLLEGRDLRRQLRDVGALSPAEARALLTPVLDALAYAHDEGVVHRDVKPENVFLASRDGAPWPVLIDFGVARDDRAESLRSRSGAVLGTPAYMSPEQAAGRRPLDARADVWSVGVVLFECLAGRAPFVGNYHEVLSALLSHDAPSLRDVCPGCPPAVSDVVDRALRREPDARYPSARAFGEALSRCEAFAATRRYEPAEFVPSASVTVRSTRREPGPPTSRRRVVALATAAAFAALAAWRVRAHTPPRAEHPAATVVARAQPAAREAPSIAPAVAAAVVEPAPARPRRVVRPVVPRPTPSARALGVNGAPLLDPNE